MCVGFFVCLNAITLGLEADQADRHPDVFLVSEHVFTAVFFVEVILHWCIEGLPLYFSEKFNWLDFFLVALSVLDAWVLTLLGPTIGAGDGVNLKSLRFCGCCGCWFSSACMYMCT